MSPALTHLQVDVLIADTSGRLHTNVNLMAELEKVKGVFDKKMPNKPKEVLLVVDSTQGQNVVMQARGFNKAVGVTGIVLTKLDGTSKGALFMCRGRLYARGIAAEH